MVDAVVVLLPSSSLALQSFYSVNLEIAGKKFVIPTKKKLSPRRPVTGEFATILAHVFLISD